MPLDKLRLLAFADVPIASRLLERRILNWFSNFRVVAHRVALLLRKNCSIFKGYVSNSRRVFCSPGFNERNHLVVRVVILKLVFVKTVTAATRIVPRKNFVVSPEVESVYFLSKSVYHSQAPSQADDSVAPDISKEGGYDYGIAVAAGFVVLRESFCRN